MQHYFTNNGFRIVGFEELGSTDDFNTEVLERRLAKSGVCTFVCVCM